MTQQRNKGYKRNKGWEYGTKDGCDEMQTNSYLG
jgi:hypothetical protein